MAIMQGTTRIQVGGDVAPQVKIPTVHVVLGDDKAQTLQIPKSHDEMMGLLAQRRQLTEQLDQATERRNDLMEKIQGAPESAKPGLQSELNVLNDRIVQLESNLNVIGQEIAGASPDLISMAEEPRSNPGDAFDEGMAAGAAAGAGSVLVIMTALIFFLRRLWRRRARTAPPTLHAADSERLQRLEHGMDAMAIEIERISEGQRYVTKLLSESHGGIPSPAGQASVREGDTARR